MPPSPPPSQSIILWLCIVLAGAVLIAVFLIVDIVRPVLFTGPPQTLSPEHGPVAVGASAASIDFVWGVSGVGPSDKNQADGVAVDDEGNVYVSGIFSNTIDIGEGLLSLTSKGAGDVFVMKFDKAGNLMWHRAYGGSADENTYDIDIDPAGDIVLNGWFAGVVDFGGIVLTSQGSQDQFVMKMSPAGDVLWARAFGGPEGDGGNEVTTDAYGNIYASAISVGTFTAGPFTATNYGARDSYIIKLSPAGEVQWVRGTRGSGNERIRAVGIGSDGGVFGGYEFSGQFIAGQVAYESGGGLDGSIVTWDANGNELWSGTIRGAGSEDVRGVAAGPAGSFYVAGFYSAGADAFGQALANAGKRDAYLAKFESDNRLAWVMTLGSPADEPGGEIASDEAGTIAYSVDANPGMSIWIDDAHQGSLSPTDTAALLLLVEPDGRILSHTTPAISTRSGGNTVSISRSGAYIAQVMKFGGSLVYGSKTFTATDGYPGFFIGSFTTERAATARSTISQANMQGAFAYSRARNGRAVLVYQNGVLVGEDYENGFAKDATHVLASGVKSFNGVILTALIEDGYVSSFDAKVSDIITEWQSAAKYPAKSTATLRQLVSLASGLQPGDPDDARLSYAQSIALPLLSSNVGTFQYGPAPFQVFGEYVKRVVAAHGYTDAADYLTKRVLAPAGVTIAQWNGAKQGEPSMAGGVSMTVDNWARFGEFMRNGGNVNGTQIVRADLLGELTKPSAWYAGYGITWWLSADTSNVGKRLPDPSVRIPGGGYSAAGARGQRLYVMPQYGLTVARFGEGGDWSDQDFLHTLLGTTP